MARAENQEQLIKRIRQLEDENSNLKEKLDDYIGRCGNFFSFVDGTPITRPSRSCRLCYRIIRSTVRGGGAATATAPMRLSASIPLRARRLRISRFKRVLLFKEPEFSLENYSNFLSIVENALYSELEQYGVSQLIAPFQNAVSLYREFSGISVNPFKIQMQSFQIELLTFILQ